MDGDTTSFGTQQQAIPNEDHSKPTITSRIKSYFSPLAGFALRHIVSSIIATIVVPPSVITAIVFIYAISQGLPPLSVIDELGAHIAIVAVLSIALFMMMLIYASLPTAIQLFNNKYGYIDNDHGTFTSKIYRIGASCGFAILLYTCISLYVLDIPNVAKYTAIIVVLLIFMMLSIAMIAFVIILNERSAILNKFGAIFTSNFV